MSAPPKPDDVARALGELAIKEAADASATAAASASSSSSSTVAAVAAAHPDLANLSKEDLYKLVSEQMNKNAAANTSAAAVAKEYKFWDTQPVPKIDETPTEHGPIEKKTLSDISTTAYPLPANFEWDSLDMTDEKQVAEVYSLLYENYVEDDDNMFRFDYSSAFLKWALMPPGYRKEWHVGVRSSTNRKLVAFISGIPQKMRAYKEEVMMVEINFLCVHKKLRAKRLAPVLIKEITRRVNLRDIWQAVYTAGVVLPKAVAQNRYYHRSLNPKKLIDIGFSRLHRNMTMTRTIKLYKGWTNSIRNNAVNEMNELASRELQTMQARVEQFQNGLRQQMEVQMRVSTTNGACFDLCVSDVSSGSLSKPEKQCVKQCFNRWTEASDAAFQHWTSKLKK